MIKFIMMCCGFAESAQTSWLIYSTIDSGGFETKEAAMKEFALDLYAKYYDDVLSWRKPATKNECCKRTALLGGGPYATEKMKEEYKFCHKCGSRLEERAFDREEFIQYIIELHHTTCDSYGDAEWANKRNLCWWPWRAEDILKAKREEIILIYENAEIEIYKALIKEIPELKAEDDKF